MPQDGSPQLGLVCVTYSEECRYRTITRTRFLKLSPDEQKQALRAIYKDNLTRFHSALDFCAGRGIRLYRVTSNLFPFSDEPIGADILREMADDLATIGRRAAELGIRILNHPDQYVVLSSDSPTVVENSIKILQRHALAFDLMGLPRSPWSALILHGGKAGRAEQLIGVINRLPIEIRSRLTLENDEYAYSAQEIFEICQRVSLPMVFDNHHHAIKEGLTSYNDPSVAEMVRAARATWPDPEWQVVHLSNGRETFADPRHSDFIEAVPAAYRSVPWIEVEAKAKEQAIERLRRDWKKGLRSSRAG